MDTLKTSSPFRWPVRGFKLKDERELYGLAELMKKGLQVDAHSPIFKIDSKSGVLVLSGMSHYYSGGTITTSSYPTISSPLKVVPVSSTVPPAPKSSKP